METNYKRMAAHAAFIMLLLSMLWIVAKFGTANITGSAVYDEQGAQDWLRTGFSNELSYLEGRFCFLIKTDNGTKEWTVVNGGTVDVFSGCDTYDFVFEFNDYDALATVMDNPDLPTLQSGKGGNQFYIGVSKYVKPGGDIKCDADFKAKFCSDASAQMTPNQLIEADLACCIEVLTVEQEELLAQHEATTGFQTELAPIRASPGQVSASSSSLSIIISIVVIILVIGGLVAGLMVYKKQQKEKQQAEEARRREEEERKEHEEHEKQLEESMGQVKEYVSSMQGQGYTNDQIKQALIQQGWQDSDIGHFFN